MPAFLAFLRFVLFVIVGAGVPALVFGMMANALLRPFPQVDRSVRLLLAGVSGLVLVYAIPAGATYALRSETLGLVTYDFMVIAANSFMALGLARRMALGSRVAAACVASAALVWAVQVSSLDGIDGELCAVLMGDHTEYAPTYSPLKFKSVEPDMTADQVQQLLGKPFDEWFGYGEDTFWRWSRSRNVSHYYRYRVVMFQNGRVTKKSAYMYCNLLD
jgi:hypothetical protein